MYFDQLLETRNSTLKSGIGLDQRSAKVRIADVAVLEAGLDVVTFHQLQGDRHGQCGLGEVVGVSVIEGHFRRVDKQRHFGPIGSVLTEDTGRVGVAVEVEEVSAALWRCESSDGIIHGRMSQQPRTVRNDDRIVVILVITASVRVKVDGFLGIDVTHNRRRVICEYCCQL